jgi:hypothetical protein
MPAPLSEQTRRHDAQHDEARHRARNRERRRQLRGLLLLAAAVLVFSLIRASLSPGQHIFHPGWWRLW